MYTARKIKNIRDCFKNGEWEDYIVFMNGEVLITDFREVAEYHADYERSLKKVGNNPYLQAQFLNGEL